MTRLLCFADLHLGALDRYDRHPGDGLRAQAEQLERLAALAAERDVDLIVFGGDLFDGPLVTPEQYVVAQQAFAELERYAPVVGIVGNGRHDLATKAVPATEVVGDYMHARPCVVRLAECSVACLPWAPLGPLVARYGDAERDDVHQHAVELLVQIAAGLRVDCDPNLPAVLLLHWSLSGSSLPTGLPVDDLREPVLDTGALEAQGWDAIVAGHIHKPQTFGGFAGLWTALYCGSLLPLNFGEERDEHGSWILELTHGEESTAEFVPLPSRRFVTIDLSCASDGATDAVGNHLAAWFECVNDDNRTDDAIVRVRVACTEAQARGIDRAQIEAALYDAGAYKVMPLMLDVQRATRARVEAAAEELDAAAAVRLYGGQVGWTEYETDGVVALAQRYAETTP